jgi:FkbM family methyltransferase
VSAAATLTRRALRSSPAARAILASPLPRRAITAARAARVLRPTPRFLAGEIGARRTGRHGTVDAGVGVHRLGRYRIGGSERMVHLRHGSRDVEIFNEIFCPARLSYEPPSEIARELEAMPTLRVADLGGNIGLFGLFALDRWRLEVLRSYEPDPANAALLQATIAANDTGGRWTLVRAAVSNERTTSSFQAGLLSESRIADDGVGTIEVPVLDLFAEPPVDLLKIDIEGAEWPILDDPRLASHPARAIVLEWHRRGCPHADARAAARELLEAAGYRSLFEGTGESHVNGLMWGLRR